VPLMWGEGPTSLRISKTSRRARGLIQGGRGRPWCSALEVVDGLLVVPDIDIGDAQAVATLQTAAAPASKATLDTSEIRPPSGVIWR